MGDELRKDELITQLQNQLAISRNEIKNLRQQITNLRHTHRNDVEKIQNILKSVQCATCIEKNTNRDGCDCEFPDFRSIGTIESWFGEKRGIPRQAGVCMSSQGVVKLHSSVINNPEYALEGLEEFSHLWILYHFHKTDARHVSTKVAPPRLNGARVGVLSTRSPHRPCPIGLTLVKLDSIVENKIYFSGVDMLDGTPVLDVKPYIPQYDNPTAVAAAADRAVDGGASDEEAAAAPLPPPPPAPPVDEGREAPDGEEAGVRVAPWINNPATSPLRVEFSERGLSQLQAVANHEVLKSTIVSVLEEDPRSVYLRKKLGNQFYTFLIQDLHVSCKFNDAGHVVTVYQIQKGKGDCECGIPQWQCQLHAQ